MWHALSEGLDAAIAGYARIRVAHDSLHINAAHRVIDHLRATCEHHVPDRLDLRIYGFRSAFQDVDLADRLAFVHWLWTKPRNQGVVVIRKPTPVEHDFHLGGNLGLRCRVRETFLDLLLAICQRPCRQSYSEVRARPVIRVLIDNHIHSLATVL